MPYYFYLARCSDDSLYAGICKDLKEREAKHNDGSGAKYTRSRLPIRFVHTEKYATKSEAMKREAEVKKWKKEEKEKLVGKKGRKTHPRKRDASRG